MNCLDARRALGAEPGRRTPELEAHLAGCPACARHAEELARFERVLRLALEVPVAAPGAARPERRRRPLYALAASLAALLALATSVWTLYPREALASALVGHMRHEPESRVRTDVEVPAASLHYVLARAGYVLAPDAPRVSYAMSCWFRGWHVPHLVVQTDDGPVTVMVLAHEHVAAPQQVEEGGYRIVIVPAARGALAVLAPDGTDPAHLAALVSRLAASLGPAG
ncbi:MAG: DUF3379 family protein [Proteobacteria bacterium]|nr:DUF3379 family protein [Pseudomonadota bacterium]